MIATLVWGIAAGCLARALLSRDKPGVVVTLVAGFAGSGLGFLVGHDLLGRHDMHLFAPGALLPSAIAALVLLLVRSRVRRTSRSKTIFG